MLVGWENGKLWIITSEAEPDFGDESEGEEAEEGAELE